MVPMLTCGLVRSNLAFATGVSSLRSSPPRCLPRRPGAPQGRRCLLCKFRSGCLLASCLGDDLLRYARTHLGIRVELQRVVRPALGTAAQVADVAEHLRQRDAGPDPPGAGQLLHGLDVAATAVQV